MLRSMDTGSAAALVAVAALVACEGRDDLDGKRDPPPGLPERPPALELVGADQQVAYDMVDNRAAAVLHVGGSQIIDMGSIDAATYAEGMVRSAWHAGIRIDGRRAALVPGRGGDLYLPIDGAPGGVDRAPSGGVAITVRARAAREDQVASVFLNEHRLGEISMPTTGWEDYRIEAPAEVVRDGENRLRFWFRHSVELAGRDTGAAIARIGVGGAPDGEVRSGGVVRDGKRLDALSVEGSARLSYYLRVPRGAPALVFAASGGGADMSVGVAGARSGAATELWRGRGGDAWEPVRVDLSAYAGEVVRIDLRSGGAAAWGRPRVVVPAEEPAAAPEPEPVDHVVVWVVSSLRADRVHGDGVPTPGFDRLARRGVRFVDARSPAPHPAPAHAALMTGAHPSGRRMPRDTGTLAERFGAGGFATALVSGNGFVHDEAGYARGFDLYDNPMRRRYPYGASILWQRARRFLRAHADDRSFVYLATVEPHLPYTPGADSLAAEWDAEDADLRFEPAETADLSEKVRQGKTRLGATERAWIQALYDAEVRDADAALAAALEDLDELGIAGRTAFILIGDHGEEMFERDNFGHGAHLHAEVLHVPLIIAAPGLPEGTDDATPVSGIDVYATALDLAGLDPASGSQGTSVLGGAASAMPRPLWAHMPGRGRALRLGRYKLIVPARGTQELYDHEVDPGERRDLMGRRPLVARYMRIVFGIGAAYRQAWSPRRWGTAANTRAAFAADQGL